MVLVGQPKVNCDIQCVVVERCRTRSVHLFKGRVARTDDTAFLVRPSCADECLVNPSEQSDTIRLECTLVLTNFRQEQDTDLAIVA